MSVIRVMGIETEYGISVPGHPHVNSMLTSSAVVNAYASGVPSRQRSRPRWDYDEETPLRDARGFDMSRAEADPSQLTDEDLGLANLILTNGARLYVDHAHPEYSSPEVLTPREAVVWDRAGMLIMEKAAAIASAAPGAKPIHLYKNNTDNKGASYGCHENYLMRRTTPFSDIVRHLTAFFVSRQVITGSGRVGLGQEGKRHGFQLSQRADFFEAEVGLETTLKRPIINTRDEPHADPEVYRRLHVIVGDANLAELSTFLKMGITSLVISMVEDGCITTDLTLADPVREMHLVSHDVSLKHEMKMRSAGRMTALQVQRAYQQMAVAYVESRFGADTDEPTLDVLAEWDRVLTALADDPMTLARDLDWVAKLSLLEGYRRRDGLDWSDSRLHLVDLQYSDVRSDRGLARRLEAGGHLRRLSTDAEVVDAVLCPPTSTRAWFRGECLRRFPEAVVAASWDSVILEAPGYDALQRIPTLDPMRGTRAHVEELLDRCRSASDLVAHLAGRDGAPNPG